MGKAFTLNDSFLPWKHRQLFSISVTFPWPEMLVAGLLSGVSRGPLRGLEHSSGSRACVHAHSHHTYTRASGGRGGHTHRGSCAHV